MKKTTANSLLQINAIKLNPANPVTWASGWKSPIYCDNRTALSFPEVRRMIYSNFAELVQQKYPEVEVIAGVATGAIAWGVGVADVMELPCIYVRAQAKAHGLSNQVEGSFKKGQKVVVIEDLVSTGGSSLAAVEALKAAGCEVLGMMAIFTYGFPVAEDNFRDAGVELTTITDYNALIESAVESGFVGESDIATLKEWRTAPQEWGK